MHLSITTVNPAFFAEHFICKRVYGYDAETVFFQVGAYSVAVLVRFSG